MKWQKRLICAQIYFIINREIVAAGNENVDRDESQNNRKRLVEADDDDFSQAPPQPIVKKPRFYTQPPSVTDSGKEIVEQFLKDKALVLPQTLQITDGFGLLKFWVDIFRQPKHQYQILARAALKILIIPATSTAVEQLFSQVKLVLPPTRNRTSNALTEAMMTLRSSLPQKNC